MQDDLCLTMLDQGCHYFYKQVFDFSDSDDKLQLLFVPASVPVSIYIKTRFSANIEFAINVIEGVTVTAEGTPCTIQNNNRTCGKTCEACLFRDPTDATGGEIIWPARISAETPQGALSVPSSQPTAAMDYPLKLDPEKKYLIDMDKINGDTGYIDIDIWWFEYCPK